MDLRDKRIVVAIGGGIAAFKAVEVVRELQRRGATVRVAMTASATRFVGPITLTGLTGTPAVVDLWDPRYAGEVHVELGAWADA
ncbi:MAG: bifunctional 4'-phosphopantothenoylcysteine decarboxylase/phosphopantothenoylcysteine synthetase, partial [Myxococcales bacterium]|nr:bifunctional 4'-phosphopantothenoylcysteine decarboxylase/phosphopantothenoylcysteine synthetase [Myxococcales bacterium]